MRVVDAIENMQNFFGLNIAYTPLQVIMNYFNKVDNTTLMTAFAALCIPLLAGLSQWYSTKLMTATSPSSLKMLRRKHDEEHECDHAFNVRILLFLICIRYRTLLGCTECIYHYPAGGNQFLS